MLSRVMQYYYPGLTLGLSRSWLRARLQGKGRGQTPAAAPQPRRSPGPRGGQGGPAGDWTASSAPRHGPLQPSSLAIGLQVPESIAFEESYLSKFTETVSRFQTTFMIFLQDRNQIQSGLHSSNYANKELV